jgi:predicted amidohydrolase
MKIAVSQINFTVGDFAGNAARILEYAARARQAGASLVVCTELALSGYCPEDLLLRPDFYRDCAAALADLADRVNGMTLVVGHPHAADGYYYNAASVLRDGAVAATYLKRRLPK